MFSNLLEIEKLYRLPREHRDDSIEVPPTPENKMQTTTTKPFSARILSIYRSDLLDLIFYFAILLGNGRDPRQTTSHAGYRWNGRRVRRAEEKKAHKLRKFFLSRPTRKMLNGRAGTKLRSMPGTARNFHPAPPSPPLPIKRQHRCVEAIKLHNLWHSGGIINDCYVCWSLNDSWPIAFVMIFTTFPWSNYARSSIASFGWKPRNLLLH